MHDAMTDAPVIGIDLGTTNSVVAVCLDGRPRVLEEDGTALVPSVVGVAADGRLLVGQAARNQLAAFPDRTIASVKRRMGQAVTLPLAGTAYTPQEISAVILRSLKARAERALGCPVSRAVITVPAFFDEPQRQATLEAGRLAGLTVERIINEPTAASLVYHAGSTDRRHVIVYDLGGGTFDVSIVRIERGVVEVLSSKGDTSLGGDDFDELLARHVAARFQQEHDHDLLANAGTRWRLLAACERAKCALSTAASVRVVEEFIVTVRGRQVSLDVEVARHEYDELIATLVDRTIGCVDAALHDSGLALSQIDELILVGGSTRTPLVQQRLRDELRRDQDIADIPVYQGESPRLEDNREIGSLRLEGLNASADCDGRILVRFELSLDGTLEVMAVESRSGISQRLAIVGALSRMHDQDPAAAAGRFAALTGAATPPPDAPGTTAAGVRHETATEPAGRPHDAVIRRACQALPTLGPDDAADVERLLRLIEEATDADNEPLVVGLVAELDDLLFYAAG